MAAQAPSLPDADRTREAVDRKPRRWKWVFRLGIVSTVVAILLAPIGVAQYFEQRGFSLRSESGDSFSIRAEKVSLGWFSPVRVSNLSIRDDTGHVLLTAETVVSARQLFQLVTDRSHPGRFIVNSPQLDVRVRYDGSNLEDLIQVLQSREKSERNIEQSAISLTNGRIDFYDPTNNLLATIDDIDLAGSFRFGTDRAIDFEFTSIVVQEDQQNAVQAAISWQGPRDGLPLLSGRGSAAVKFDPFPLQLVQPFLNRTLPELNIDNGSVGGQLLVKCDFTDTQTISATGRLTTHDVQATTHNGSGPLKEYQWDKEEVAFQIDGTLEPHEDTIRFSEVMLQSTPLTIAAAGTVSDVSGAAVVDISGKLRYEIAPLVHTLEAEYGQHIQVAGLQSQSIRIRGPMALVVDGRTEWDVSRLSIETDLRWQSADLFGLRSEQATIGIQFHEGILSLDPRPVPLSGGRLAARPQITFLNAPPVVHLGAGPALEDVAFTPEMCRLWLKYLSPPMADATRINGRFSISCEEGQIPLQNLSEGRLRGLLHVQSAEVRPGPFAETVIGIVGRIQELIAGKPGWSLPANNRLFTMEDQRIPFVMEEGRVHHEHLEFIVAGAAVQTSGSVGFDDSLDLLISIPLPDSWLSKEDLRGMLGGEVLRIPVRGTLDRPQFDLLPLRELAQRMALRATGGLLQKLLD